MTQTRYANKKDGFLFEFDFYHGMIIPFFSFLFLDRSILNYYFQTRCFICIGKIINKSILNTIKNYTTLSLGHPYLISEMCFVVGVGVSSSEEILNPSVPVIKEKFSLYSSKNFER